MVLKLNSNFLGWLLLLLVILVLLLLLLLNEIVNVFVYANLVKDEVGNGSSILEEN